MIIESNYKKVSQFEILNGKRILSHFFLLEQSKRSVVGGFGFGVLFGVRVGSVRFGSVR